MDPKTETWTPIANFPNYMVSTFGNVKNIISQKILKNSIKAGYYHVSLVNANVHKTLKVHRLVANAFISNFDNKPEVNHVDKNKLNNNVENLEWVTRSENMKHSFNTSGKITNNKSIKIDMIDANSNQIIDTFDSIATAANWLVINCGAKNVHSAQNSISNCFCNLSSTSFGYKWKAHDDIYYVDEVWKQIDIHASNEKLKYFVSNLGRYKNGKGIIMSNYKINENGYIRVNINGKTYLLHRLIALTFLDNPFNKSQINHIDGNKLNNNVSNLEWATASENCKHKFKSGLGNNLTKQIVQLNLNSVIIKNYNSIISASQETKISKSNISGVLRGVRKTAGGFVWKYLEN